ncbi:hypothetical protein RAA17_11925 [Komagataeibacter rhaeticus]|nr:hypothetical protein [Komagataeibacter rhaeticus]
MIHLLAGDRLHGVMGVHAAHTDLQAFGCCRCGNRPGIPVGLRPGGGAGMAGSGIARTGAVRRRCGRGITRLCSRDRGRPDGQEPHKGGPGQQGASSQLSSLPS